MERHFTDGMTTCATGRPCPPFLIKSLPGKGKSGKKARAADVQLPPMSDSDWVGLNDEGEADGKKANIGLGITQSGSMVLNLFHIWCQHFTSKVISDGTRRGSDGELEPKQVRVVGRRWEVGGGEGVSVASAAPLAHALMG